MGRRKRLLTKKTSKEDGILVVGLDSSDSSGSTLTNSAKLLLLCPAAACLLRLLLLSDVTQWALRIDFTKKIVYEIIFKFRKVDFTDKIGTDYFWIYLKNRFHEKNKNVFVYIFSSLCVVVRLLLQAYTSSRTKPKRRALYPRKLRNKSYIVLFWIKAPAG